MELGSAREKTEIRLNVEEPGPIVDTAPRRVNASLYPFDKLIDRNPEDNVTAAGSVPR